MKIDPRPLGRNLRQLLPGFCALFLLVACASPVQRVELPVEQSYAPSADRFWQHLAGHSPREWFHLLNTHEEAYDWRITLIDSAHESIELETFLWKPDFSGAAFVSHLLAAADRGVRVRLLLDDSFTAREDQILRHLDAHPGISLRLYNPYAYRVPDMAGRALINAGDFNRVNHRMHNKTLIIDGWAVIVGGRNLADEYFGLHRDYNFRDMEVLAMGASVAQVSAHFDRFWNSGWSIPIAQLLGAASSEADLRQLRAELAALAGPVTSAGEDELAARWEQVAKHAVSGAALFMSDDPAADNPAAQADRPDQLAAEIRQAIDGTDSELIAISAYLVPTEALESTLEAAVDRGVRVRLLTNSMRSNNHLSAHAAYGKHIRDLLEAGVELYEVRADAHDRERYMQGPVADKKLGLHAKFLLLDQDRVFIGSSNLDPRSLQLNTEVGLMIHSAALNGKLRAAIADDFLPQNSWSVALEEGRLSWRNDSEVRYHSPSDSVFQQLESWFFGLLPIDSQM
ncbi:phospholipase D family protein [Seongchinamella sediminis]|uniref:Phospholipase D family protein n=1 Tax=Seongchinamella sediminis TaxID=2283635 RepID=A0A3L7E0J9_9GAMM|nr:phospholipase D family protein [Seongchinamella sediminis]RLQ22445.1 phospholipase D family protein [Seongchinamella sediminis]